MNILNNVLFNDTCVNAQKYRVNQVHNATSLCVPKAKWYFAIYESFESLKIQRHYYTKLNAIF